MLDNLHFLWDSVPPSFERWSDQILGIPGRKKRMHVMMHADLIFTQYLYGTQGTVKIKL